MNSAIASRNALRRRLKILLENTLVLPLLCSSLVSAVTELRRSVDPFELDLLQSPPACMCEHRLAQSDNALLDTRASTLKKNEVILDLTVADETTKTVNMSAHITMIGLN